MLSILQPEEVIGSRWRAFDSYHLNWTIGKWAMEMSTIAVSKSFLLWGSGESWITGWLLLESIWSIQRGLESWCLKMGCHNYDIRSHNMTYSTVSLTNRCRSRHLQKATGHLFQKWPMHRVGNHISSTFEFFHSNFISPPSFVNLPINLFISSIKSLLRLLYLLHFSSFFQSTKLYQEPDFY